MLRYLIILFTITISSNILSAKTKVVLSGNITNLSNGKNINAYIYRYRGNQFYLIDSISIDAKGDFKYTINDIIEPGLFKIRLPNRSSRQFILSETEKELAFSSASYLDWKQGKTVIHDSKENKAYRHLLSTLSNYNNAITTIHKSFSTSSIDSFYRSSIIAYEKSMDEQSHLLNKALDKIKAEYSETFVAKSIVDIYKEPSFKASPAWEKEFDTRKAMVHHHYFDFIDFNDATILNTPALRSKLQTYLAQYSDAGKINSSIEQILTTAKVDSKVFNYCARNLFQYFQKSENEAAIRYMIFKYIEPNKALLNHPNKAMFAQYKKTMVGTQIADFKAFNIFGQEVTLSKVIEKNGPVLLHFWHSANPNSKSYINELRTLYKEYKDDGFQLIGISFDQNAERWKKVISENKILWPNIADLKGEQSPILKHCGINQLPYALLISNERKVLLKNPGLEELNDFLDKIESKR